MVENGWMDESWVPGSVWRMGATVPSLVITGHHDPHQVPPAGALKTQVFQPFEEAERTRKP